MCLLCCRSPARCLLIYPCASSSFHRYCFPLDENGAVCGFEAFINGKHVIGVVKEKEQARREYKEAISKGHGA